MALLKAFVCQVLLFGLYKLFLEEIVEAHLVPDELTRNCLVGFVCLVCFGIQLYTDKADEDNAEADENPKAKSESRGTKSTKTSGPSEISATREAVGSNTSSPATAHSGVFAHFSPNVMKMDGTGVSDVPVPSTEKSSYNQETTTNPVLNGFSETKVYEESDDDGLEIDQFVAKKSDKEKVEQLKTIETKDAEPIKSEDSTDEAKNLRADEVTKPQDATEEATQSTEVEPEEVEPFKSEDVTAEADQLISIEAEDVKVIKSEDVIEEVDQSRANEVEAIEPKELTAVVESKCLIANGEAEEVKPSAVEPEQIELIREAATREAEQSRTVEVEDVEVIKSEDVVEKVNQSRTKDEVVKPEEVTEAVVESKCLIANGKEVEVIKPESATEEVRQSRAMEDEGEATESEEVTAVMESKCLISNGEAEEVKPRAIETELISEDVTSEAEQLRTVEAENVGTIKSDNILEIVSQSRTEVEGIKPEEVTEAVVESKCLVSNGEEVEVIKLEFADEKIGQSRAIEDEVEATKSEDIAETVVESECLLANGEDITSTQDTGKNTNLDICESEAQMTNGIAEESLNIDSLPSNIIEEIKSKECAKDEAKIGSGQETTLPSQPGEYTKDITESLPSPQTSNTTSISTTGVNDLETDNKNNAETTTQVHTAVSSPSEKLTVSTSRQKTTVAADVCVAPITIDISFIYACH